MHSAEPVQVLATLVPKVFSQTPRHLSYETVQHTLREAMHAGEFCRAAHALCDLDQGKFSNDALSLALRAKETCATIAGQIAAERDAMLRNLQQAGLSTSAIAPDAEGQRAQFHSFGLAVSPLDMESAIMVCRTYGYAPWQPVSGGALRSYLATRSEMTLVKDDANATRLVLRFRSPTTRAKLRRVFRPAQADYELVQLPASLAAFYGCVKPMRKLAQALRVLPRPPADLGPFLGTPQSLIAPLLAHADIAQGDVVVDLGCGDGRVLIEAARALGCRAIGVERDEELVKRARLQVRDAGLQHLVRIDLGDAGKAPLDNASVVFLFLPVGQLAGLFPKLRARLARGARVLIHEQQPLPGLPRANRVDTLIGVDAVTVAYRWQF